MNITIDGPGGSGKSTIAKLVAKKLNISYLDTGAMYRALGFYVNNKGIDLNDEHKVIELLEHLEMEVWTENEVVQVAINGQNITPFIREHRVSMLASTISKIPAVRMKMVELQRKIAMKSDCIMDGRDCGSFILPNAKHKFYMTASVEVRAERRQKELAEKGQNLSLDEIKADIEMRDKQDMTRKFAPLVIPEGAVVIDTSVLKINEIVDIITEYVCK